MTAEVLIMNQQAVVLAADSATTVTTWIDGKREDRYFKGTNKLFQLSAVHPVGLMIYGSASLHEVPWELLIKDFRNSIRGEGCERLSGYSKRFFDFVKAHPLYPDALRSTLFRDEAIRAAYLNSSQLPRRNRSLRRMRRASPPPFAKRFNGSAKSYRTRHPKHRSRQPKSTRQ